MIVAGAPLARDALVQSRGGASISEVRQWLEEANARLEGAAGCSPPPVFSCDALRTCDRITTGAGMRRFNDVVFAYP